MVFQLDHDIWFPDPHQANDDGLLAIGGDLSTERLLLAYSNGIFPWYSFRGNEDILWYCPHDRFVIFPEEIHVSHSMRTLINKKQYDVTFNKEFDAVIWYCAQLRYEMPGAWLGEDMIAAFILLHEQGFAASVEVWENATGHLVGGLYGVVIGNAFFGESMFSLVPSASKLALIHLAKRMQADGATLIDCQFHTPHLASMGGRYISYDKYMSLLRQNSTDRNASDGIAASTTIGH